MDARTPPAEPFRLEDMEVRTDLGGSEGLDPSHMSRMRLQFLLDQNQTLVAQAQFADAKAGALMTLIGLLALKGPVDLAELSPAAPFGLGFAGVSAACLAACIWAIVPRYPGPSVRAAQRRRDRFSWPGLAAPDHDPLEHAAFVRHAEASQLVVSVAQSNVAVARVLLAKFRALRVAFALAFLDFAMVVGRLALG